MIQFAARQLPDAEGANDPDIANPIADPGFRRPMKALACGTPPQVRSSTLIQRRSAADRSALNL
jgi:hypothetical protein